MPLITILTAVYNAADTLPRCLDSLLCQTLSDIEVICIDDASTDVSPAILDGYARRDPRLHVIHLPTNGGQARARNAGLAQARGEYIGMVDADDWLAPDALHQAWAVARCHPDADAVLFDLIRAYPDGHDEPFIINGELNNSWTGPEAMRLSLTWQIHGLYIVRSAIHHAYPYDDSARLYSDDNTTRLHYLHSRRVYASAGRYYYWQNPHSATRRISPLYFQSLIAQHHMRQLLEAEGTDASTLAHYDRYRWLQLIDNCYYLRLHRRAFSRGERREARTLIRHAWHTFPAARHTYPSKFGYRHCPTYPLFRCQEALYFTLRLLLRGQ